MINYHLNDNMYKDFDDIIHQYQIIADMKDNESIYVDATDHLKTFKPKFYHLFPQKWNVIEAKISRLVADTENLKNISPEQKQRLIDVMTKSAIGVESLALKVFKQDAGISGLSWLIALQV